MDKKHLTKNSQISVNFIDTIWQGNVSCPYVREELRFGKHWPKHDQIKQHFSGVKAHDKFFRHEIFIICTNNLNFWPYVALS